MNIIRFHPPPPLRRAAHLQACLEVEQPAVKAVVLRDAREPLGDGVDDVGARQQRRRRVVAPLHDERAQAGHAVAVRGDGPARRRDGDKVVGEVGEGVDGVPVPDAVAGAATGAALGQPVRQVAAGHVVAHVELRPGAQRCPTGGAPCGGGRRSGRGGGACCCCRRAVYPPQRPVAARWALLAAALLLPRRPKQRRVARARKLLLRGRLPGKQLRHRVERANARSWRGQHDPLPITSSRLLLRRRPRRLAVRRAMFGRCTAVSHHAQQAPASRVECELHALEQRPPGRRHAAYRFNAACSSEPW